MTLETLYDFVNLVWRFVVIVVSQATQEPTCSHMVCSLWYSTAQLLQLSSGKKEVVHWSLLRYT